MIRVRPCLVEGTLLEAVAALVPFVVFGADQIVQVGPGFSFSPATVTVVPGGMVTSTFQGQLWQGEANPCDSTGRAAMIAAARRPGTLLFGPIGAGCDFLDLVEHLGDSPGFGGHPGLYCREKARDRRSGTAERGVG